MATKAVSIDTPWTNHSRIEGPHPNLTALDRSMMPHVWCHQLLRHLVDSSCKAIRVAQASFTPVSLPICIPLEIAAANASEAGDEAIRIPSFIATCVQ